MNILENTKKLCQQYNIKPNRSKGQNFLVNEDVYDTIIKAAGLKTSDIILEIGPGLGFLTEKLAQNVGKVITVELDDKLASITKKRIKEQGFDNVEVVNKDVLKVISNFEFRISNLFDNAELNKIQYKVVANLPYNITSRFLRYILERPDMPESLTLMLQLEVAERIVAAPGKMSKLSVSVQYFSEPKIIKKVVKEDFWPAPEVDSAIIRINRKERKLNEKNEKLFFRLVRIGFSSRRKMLRNNLAAGLHTNSREMGDKIKLAGFSENIRAQELSVSDWQKLFAGFRDFML